MGSIRKSSAPHSHQFSVLAAFTDVGQFGVYVLVSTGRVCLHCLGAQSQTLSYVYWPLYDLFCEMPARVICPFLKTGLKEDRFLNCESIRPSEQLKHLEDKIDCPKCI